MISKPRNNSRLTQVTGSSVNGRLKEYSHLTGPSSIVILVLTLILDPQHNKEEVALLKARVEQIETRATIYDKHVADVEKKIDSLTLKLDGLIRLYCNTTVIKRETLRANGSCQ